ncbi:tetratricopeptide repeat protein [Massilia sp. LXY-6]|uniref:glycosyltransferase family 9 protein n=1 Tax=Massilia sp. LXY-6 TaxID=3379823 RepID=UPI003EE383FC
MSALVNVPIAPQAESLFAQGLEWHRQGLLEQALAAYEQALQLQPGYLDVLHHIGILAYQAGDYASAEQFLHAAIEVDGSVSALHSNLGNVLKATGRHEAALESYAHALDLDQANVDAWYNCGNTLQALRRFDAALACYDRALALQADDAQAWNNRAAVLQELRRHDEALQSYGMALQHQPGNAEAHWNRGLLHLQHGRFAEGWRGYEWRWQVATLSVSRQRREFPQPLWLGREDLAGKTILLHAEQGLGDTLQFCRYVDMVAARGARVILEVPPTLLGLMRTLAGPAKVVARGAALPLFDYHCPLMSLPLAFDSTLATVPAPAGYLRADAGKAAAWDALLGPRSKLRVGVAWRGSQAHKDDDRRSIDFAVFASVLSPACEFVSLQDRHRPEDVPLLAASTVREYGQRLADFSDTAALCAAVDLVLTVDTSIAHLAGALGKPAWILLPANADWRWLLERADSPWYPSARLVRQQPGETWAAVLARVRTGLDAMASSAKP